MSNEDGNLSVEIGFKINKAELEKLINDATERFKKGVASETYAISKEYIERMVGKQFKGKGKVLSEHTGSAVSVTSEMANDVKQILSQLRRSNVSGIPSRTTLPRTDREHVPTAMLKSIQETNVGNLQREKIQAIFDKKSKEVSEIVSPVKEKIWKDEYMSKFNKGRMREHDENLQSRYLFDSDWRKMKKPPHDYFHKDSGTWKPVAYPDEMVRLNSEDLSSQDVFTQLAELGGSPELLELMGSEKGEKVLKNRLKNMTASVSEEGSVSIGALFDIPARFTNQIKIASRMVDLLLESLKSAKMTVEGARTHDEIIRDLVQSGGGGKKELRYVKDLADLNRLKVTSVDAQIMTGDSSTEQMDMPGNTTQTRLAEQTKEYKEANYQRARRQYSKQRGVTMGRDTAQNLRAMSRFPGDKLEEDIMLRSASVIEMLRSGELGRAEPYAPASFFENEFGMYVSKALGSRSSGKTEGAQPYWDEKENKMMLPKDMVWSESEKKIMSDKRRTIHNLIGGSDSSADARSLDPSGEILHRDVSAEHRSLKTIIDRRWRTKKQLDQQLASGRIKESMVGGGRTDQYSIGEQHKIANQYSISQSTGRGIGLIHTEKRLSRKEGETRFTEVPVLDDPEVGKGSPFTTSKEQSVKGRLASFEEEYPRLDSYVTGLLESIVKDKNEEMEKSFESIIYTRKQLDKIAEDKDKDDEPRGTGTADKTEMLDTIPDTMTKAEIGKQVSEAFIAQGNLDMMTPKYFEEFMLRFGEKIGGLITELAEKSTKAGTDIGHVERAIGG